MPSAPKKPRETKAQLIQRYNALLARHKTLTKENALLREDVEDFNRKLLECERELEQRQQRDADLCALLQQMRDEEARLPLRQGRSVVREQWAQECLLLADELQLQVTPETPAQEIVTLNTWLVTTNRFVDKVVGDYIRHRDRVLVIRDYEMVKQWISIGIIPDIIVTGAYDFGLDDPEHTKFLTFLEHAFTNAQKQSLSHELYIITLSSNMWEQPNFTTHHARYSIRHEFISKFQGLNMTFSEIRFFLEMRRCQPDIMQADHAGTILAFDDVAEVIIDVQLDQKTGVLVVLSDEQPLKTRWVFHMFFLSGKMVKIEHTLGTSVVFSTKTDEEPLEKITALFSYEAAYDRNSPKYVYFFLLHQLAVLHELRQQSIAPFPL